MRARGAGTRLWARGLGGRTDTVVAKARGRQVFRIGIVGLVVIEFGDVFRGVDHDHVDGSAVVVRHRAFVAVRLDVAQACALDRDARGRFASTDAGRSSCV